MMVIGQRVMAKRVIRQNPLDGEPDVPEGQRGTVEDEIDCDGLIAVDFGEPFGVVLCERNELLTR